ncbi:hypothetical protein B0A48_01530 [Cryoendolithus antarcticus]|uniref:Major facilitator superfamily (MFS) profile domain-containing protein n=1 Tax=Cryoendolithus antarcticus TaxID=1507870 RepID=A0A1V8TQ26_9PEZI|nr:hypothetical protein B0A48_01530 [Cryoendolithus antarcticus]
MLYFLVTLCAGSAIVQGMDQTAVNGAQTFYFEEFNITGVWQQGLLNGAPYLCSVLIGCWTNAPLNKLFGRRGTIFVSCIVSFITGIWMAAANSWYNLLIARFALGLAVGAKSSTTPVYAAECAPKNIRGALTMMWQMWTAFGIMLGFVVSVAFQNTTIIGGPTSPWRWMLGSTSIPPVCLQVFFCPESPRWLMEKGKFDRAWKAAKRLRNHDIQAARDIYYSWKLLEIEASEQSGKSLWRESFMVKRNRRAAQSSFFVMFMQQFCGINVIAYYSTQIFMDAGFERPEALLVSLGTRVVNFLFAIPAIYTIDTLGRRNLLLTTFPMMAVCPFWCGFSFLAPDRANGDPTQTKLGSIAAAIFVFMAAYSPGMGPVPFTYSAEAFPLYILFLSLTWPALVAAFSPTGAFAWYGAWNLFGWVFAYFLLPETKNLTLEELDTVFSVGNRQHAKYYTDSVPWYWTKYVKRGDVEPREAMYRFLEEEVKG